MDDIRPGFLGGEYGAVETARQHHETRKRHVFSHQENRVLLRAPAARLRRHLQAPARPQRGGRDRGAQRLARQPQHGVRFLRHQAHRQGLGRSRARSQDDPPRRTIRWSGRCRGLASLCSSCRAIPPWSISPNCCTTTRIRRGFLSCASRCGKRPRRSPPTAERWWN